jgi:hypothetical protein
MGLLYDLSSVNSPSLGLGQCTEIWPINATQCYLLPSPKKAGFAKSEHLRTFGLASKLQSLLLESILETSDRCGTYC